MNTRKSSIVAALAAIGLLCTVGSALAAQKAVVSEDADLHAKPKLSSAVLDTVDQDEVVKVTQCQGNWCYVTHPGPDGWIKKIYLANDDGSDFSYGDTGDNGGNPIDAHAIQPFYAGLLARSCGLHITMANEGEAIAVTAA